MFKLGKSEVKNELSTKIKVGKSARGDECEARVME